MEWTIIKCWILLWTIVISVLAGETDEVRNIGLIGCVEKLSNLKIELRTTEVEELMVECPRSCLDEGFCYVIGSGPYTKTSSVCCAAIHSGALNNTEGGRVYVDISYVAVPQFIKSTRNNVTTRSQYRISPVTFQLRKVKTQTIKTSISTTTSVSTITTRKMQPIYHGQPLHDSLKTEEPSFTSTTEETTMKYPKTTTRIAVIKTEATTKVVPIIQETATVNNNLIQDPLIEKISLTIGAFFAGAVCVLILVCIKRKKKKMIKKRCGGGKFSSGTQRFDEGDICVCYQNLNSSKQGLLFDPETCDRPCPIRKPNSDEDSFMHEASLISEKELKKSSKRGKKLEIVCDDNKCVQECPGACNPALYDF